MNKDEQSLLDLLNETIKEPAKPAPVEAPSIEEIPCEKAAEPEAPAKEEAPIEESAPAEEVTNEEPAPAEEAPLAVEEEIREKKKNIKFLILYLVVFVIVISGLIGGSYMVSRRIHKEMSDNNVALNHSHDSTLKNIQNQNTELKEKNSALETKNADLSAEIAANEELMAAIGHMVEHDQYLAAAQNAYIQENKELAASICNVIDRSKLSIPNRAYFDLLKEKLDL